jgi:hypothetical protein
MQAWSKQTPPWTLQLKLVLLKSQQTHLLWAYIKLTGLQCQQTPLRTLQLKLAVYKDRRHDYGPPVSN